MIEQAYFQSAHPPLQAKASRGKRLKWRNIASLTMSALSSSF